MLSLRSFDEFLATAPRRPLVRLVDRGQPVAPAEYTVNRRLGGAEFDDVVDPVRVARKFSAGATVVAQSLHRTHLATSQFVFRLGAEISHPLQANAYLTPPGSQGLATHSDRHDVFVLQTHGSKVWWIDDIGDVELEDGDVLYIPAGTQHRATSTDAVSLHVTIGALRVTYRSVVERLLRDGPTSLDDPLPLRYRNDDVSIAPQIDSCLVDVVAHLSAIDPEQAQAAERARSPQRLTVPGVLDHAVALLELDGSERIARSHCDWTVSRDDSGVHVVGGGQRLSAPDACSPAIDGLVGGDPSVIDDLPGLDSASCIILARRLLNVGLCRLTTVE